MTPKNLTDLNRPRQADSEKSKNDLCNTKKYSVSANQSPNTKKGAESNRLLFWHWRLVGGYINYSCDVVQ